MLSNKGYSAQNAVLGAILIDAEFALDAIGGIVGEEHFDDGLQRLTYKIAAWLVDKGKPVDPVIISGYCLKKGYFEADINPRFMDWMTISTAANAKEYAIILRDERNRQRIEELLSETTVVGDPAQLAETLIGELTAISDSAELSARDAGDIALSAWNFQNAPDTKALLTGWSKLDSLLGGFRPGNFIVIAGKPGLGKSAMAMDIALKQAMGGVKTLIISCEMSEIEIFQRYYARLSGVDLDKITQKKTTEDEIREVGRASSALFELRGVLKITEKAGITLSEIRQEAKAHKGVELIIVDYIQIMGWENPKDTESQALMKITAGLKLLAKNLKCTVIAASQFNRAIASETQEPGMSAFRGSSTIENDVDKAILLWRLDETSGGSDMVKLGVKVGKNRQGKRGTVVMNFDGAHQRFTELAEEYRNDEERQYKPKSRFRSSTTPVPWD